MGNYDLIIIGGGPAGITAGIYAARHKMTCLLVAKTFGGQMARKAVDIENYPGFKKISGMELIEKFVSHLKANEAEILQDTAAEIKKNGNSFSVSTAGKKKLKARAVIIASGADPRPLEVPGEKNFIGKGVSYCTACDAPMFAGKTVAVVGGGNSGFEAAAFMVKYAKKVYILEFAPKVKASLENQQLAKDSGIEVVTNAALKKIQGKDFVDSLVYQDRKTKKTHTLEVQGIFVEIGSIPATGFVKGLVEFSERDEIKVDRSTCETKTSGLFAAGDVTDAKWKQIVIAAGEGCKAALAAYEYVRKQQN